MSVARVTKGHTGLWMGLWVPKEAAEQLALVDEEAAEPPENLHLTLAYFGEAAALGDESIEAVLKAAEVFAIGSDPIEGHVSGIGRFDPAEDGDKAVLYASFDSPDLPAFRQSLVQTMANVGVAVDDTHGFTPHITLAYADPERGANMFPLGTNQVPIRFAELWVGIGERYYTFSLEGRSVSKADMTTLFDIRKRDDERRFVFGWANISIRQDGEQILDHHKDMIDPEDLEGAAYEFTLNYRETGEMHEGESKGHLIESFVVTPEKLEKMGLTSDALPIGWWVGFYVPDDSAWAKVKDGTYKMFSIEGTAVREVVE